MEVEGESGSQAQPLAIPPATESSQPMGPRPPTGLGGEDGVPGLGEGGALGSLQR
jgi:hypothetical protein